MLHSTCAAAPGNQCGLCATSAHSKRQPGAQLRAGGPGTARPRPAAPVRMRTRSPMALTYSQTCACERQIARAAPVQVRTRSPMPARPPIVSGCAPSATASRVISLRPRVMSAARPLQPKPRPSLMPHAIASTFLSAPPSSTPAGARGVGQGGACCALATRQRRAHHAEQPIRACARSASQAR